MPTTSTMIRPNGEVFHSRIHGSILELEAPWWPLTDLPVTVEMCKPAHHADALTVRWLNDDEKVTPPSRPTEKPKEPGRQMVLVGGVDGAQYRIAVGSFHFYVRVVAELPA